MGRRAIRKRTLPLLLLLGLVYAAWRLPSWSKAWIESGLVRTFQRDASVAAVRYHLFPLEIEIEDLRVAGAVPGAPPFLSVARIRVAPSLTPRFDGRVVLSRVDLEHPVLRVNAWAHGGDDI